MGNAPSSSRSSTPPSSPPPPPRVPPRVHSPPPRDALALMRGQSLTSKSQPAPAPSLPSPLPPTPAVSLPSPIPPAPAISTPSPLPPTPKTQNIEIQPPTPKSRVPPTQELPQEQDVGEAKPGELEGPSEEEQTSHRTDWAAARAAMERAIGSLRDRAEEIARETMERRREQRAMEEEEAKALHERKMTIYEDAEPGLFDELRFPPGLERGGSESDASAMFHSSEPTADTLVDEPEQVMDEPNEGDLEKLLEKLQVQEVQEAVTVVVQEGPAPVQELTALPDEPVSPELSQLSSEEPVDEVANVVEEAEEAEEPEEPEASQEAMPIVQETPIITEDHSPDQPLVSSDQPASLLEEASDTQSDHLTSSVEYPRPDTPHPTLDDTRAASPVPFPVTSEPEDQGYSTQDDEDRVTQTQTQTQTQTSPRASGKHVHWGGVEAQPAYTRPQEDEEHAEELPSPPFSRLLLPAPAPVEPPRDLRAERTARIAAARRPVLPAVQKASRKLEPGLYTVTDVRWGMALDLSGADNRSVIAFGSHGWENQQWEFQSCGSGFVVKSVSSGLFLALEDLQGLHRDGSTEVVAGQFPMCWEMEVMDNGSADSEEDGDGDVYARYFFFLSRLVT
ncbi:hypothetical protein H4582DRAFT_117902 [Lactarius indigo]|nr:hypothetical protein H4582DRAFT_117902 [Lactarius indigo]